MNYLGLFKSRYHLQGRDWLKHIDPEDRAVFVDIGLQAADFGKLGGQALVAKRGREHMAKIGRIGAIASNIKRSIIKQAREELGL